MEESDIEPLQHRSSKRKSSRKKVNALLFLLLAGLTLFFLYDHYRKEVMIVDGAERLSYNTFSRTVGEFFEEKNLVIGDFDKVLPGKEEQLHDGDIIVIKRAIPVYLHWEGRAERVWTHASEVAGLLREQKIPLGVDDLVFPVLNHSLAAGDAVVVIRVEKDYLVCRDNIPYNTIRVPNKQLEKGVVRVRQEGSEGVEENIWEIVKQDGEEVSRVLISTNLVQEPRDRVLEYGEMDIVSRGGRGIQFERAVTVSATAYCPGTPGSGCPVDARGASRCTGFHNDGYTYTGVRAVAGNGTRENPHIIAVDPAFIPLKSMVYIEGYGYARAEDTGSAVKGPSIDLLFNTHAEALSFGRRTLDVYLLAD